jgi:uncharacterized membrane protein YecN with MAPEG domain
MSTLPTITLFYAGILSLMAIVLGFGAGAIRGKAGVSIGDGGMPALHVAMRRHGNFIEWVPMILITLGLLEMHGVGSTALHSMGAGLVVARVLHAIGLKADTIKSIPRLIGAGVTTVIMAVAAVWAIIIFL